jgi:hypothetical protein
VERGGLPRNTVHQKWESGVIVRFHEGVADILGGLTADTISAIPRATMKVKAETTIHPTDMTVFYQNPS